MRRCLSFWLVVFFIALTGSAFCQSDSYVGPGVWYLRVTNTHPAASLCIRALFMLNRDPWTERVYGGTDGWGKQAPSEDKWLAPGRCTQWLDMGSHMTRQAHFPEKKRYIGVHVGAMYPGTGAPLDLRLRLGIAKGPEHAPVRTIEVNESSPSCVSEGMFLSVPPKLPTQSFLISSVDGEVLTFEEAAENQLKWVVDLGPVKNPPVHCWFAYSRVIYAGLNLRKPSRLERTSLKLVKALGYTNFSQYASEAGDDAALQALGYPTYRQNYVHGYTDDYLVNVHKDLKSKGLDRYVGLVSFGDEVNVYHLQMSVEEQNKLFVVWLKNRGADPALYVRPEDEFASGAAPKDERWSYVRLFSPTAHWRDGEKAAKDLQVMQLKPQLVYDSTLFRYELWFEENRRRSELARKLFGEKILIGSNFNSCSMNPSQWVDMFRTGGLTTPWAEDWWWDLSETSPQSWGLVFGVMRRAAAFHNSPMVFYTIPDNAERADHLLRMNYLAVANQVKHLDHFNIFHQGFGTCDYVEYAQSRDKFVAFRRIADAIGKVDKRLYSARMRPAQVAIIFTKPGSVWSEAEATCDPAQNPQSNSGPVIHPGNFTLQQEEMRSVWLALRHAGIPVDVITDDDIADGYITKYQAAFLIGAEMQRSAVPGLVRWVTQGGTLVGLCGGGLLDEYRCPIAEMHQLYGIGDVNTRRTRMVVIPGDILKIGSLASEEPLGTVMTDRVEMPVLCMRQNLAPLGSKVLSTYENGGAAAVRRYLGKGRAVLCGFMPGLAYVRPALVLTEQGYPFTMPENYPADRRQILLSLLSPFKPAQPVTTSDYLVEATVQDGRYGSVVTLVNFRNNPVKVTIRLPGLSKAKKVVSSQYGALKFRRGKGILTVTLNVDIGDILAVD